MTGVTRPLLPSVYVNALQNTNATHNRILIMSFKKYVLAAACNSIPIIPIMFCILFSISS